MSLKEWLALLILFLTYLLVGGAIFLQIESAQELEQREAMHMERRRVQELLQLHIPEDSWDRAELEHRLTEYCGKPIFNGSEDEEEAPFKWNLYNSFYFAFTVVSSIGYGNLAPTCMLARILCILYALIGIPMNGILLASLGEFFSKTFLRAHHRYKEQRYESRMALITDIILYLIPGFILFIFLPAGLFVVFEGWPYDVAVYYAFVTLTTVGFGDYVAGQTVRPEYGAWFIVYQVLIIWWIVFGLGYLIMILGFITRAMRSKQMLDLERKMAHKIKRTQSKLWRGMRDMGYLRRLLNEVYLLKFRPIYRDPDAFSAMSNLRERSKSLPSIRRSDKEFLADEFIESDAETTSSGGRRRRAYSERTHSPVTPIHRNLSESDLGRIDKRATFAANNSMAPSELLAHVVEALSCAEEELEEMEDLEEEYENEVDVEEGRCRGTGGFHGFTDDEILKSENHRSRAASEAPATSLIQEEEEEGKGHPAEWTWYGTAASKRIHELMRLRHKSRRDSSPPPPAWKSFRRRSSRLTNRSIGGKGSDSESNAPQLSAPPPIPPRAPGNLWMLDPKLQKRLSVGGDAVQAYHRRTFNGRHSSCSPAMERRSVRLPSMCSEPDVVPVLEETSLADFLRALDSLHTRVGVPKPPDESGKKFDSCHSSLQWVSEKAGNELPVLPPRSPKPIFPTGMRRASLFNNRRLRRTSISSTDSGSVAAHPKGQKKLRKGSLRL